MPAYYNQNGTWREYTPYVRDGGTWREPTSAFVNQNGTWRQYYAATPRITTRQDITGTTNFQGSLFTGRIYMVGAGGSSSRDSNQGGGYGGMVIVDVNNAVIGVCTAGPGGGSVRSDGRMQGGGNPTGGARRAACASSVAHPDGTEWLIAGGAGGPGKFGRGGDAGENANYVGGCMGQRGNNGTGAGPNRGQDYSQGGTGGGGRGPDGGGGGGGYGGGGGSCHGCCGSSDSGGGGGGNRVLNYNSYITSTIKNRSSRYDRGNLPSEIINNSNGVPFNRSGRIVLQPA